MKQKIDRITTGAKSISLRTLAMVLCFVMLLSAIGVGTVITAIAKSSNAKAAAAGALSRAVADVAVEEEDENEIVRGMKDDLAFTGANVDLTGSGYNLENNSRVYLDAHLYFGNTNGTNVKKYVFFVVQYASDKKAAIIKMDHIANTQIYTCYTNSSNCYANTSVGCVYFFTSDSDWSTKEYVKNDVTSIYTHINGNLGGGKISNTYGLSITKDYVYYFYLNNSGDLRVSSHNDVYALPNNSASGELRGGQHKASVYTSTDDSTYAYDSDQTHGGDIQVGGFGWSTGYVTTAKSYAVSSKSFSEGNYSYFNTPAKTSWITLRVNEVYDGYIFKGWYKNSALISEDSEYSYRVDDTNDSDIHARFYKPTYSTETPTPVTVQSGTAIFNSASNATCAWWWQDSPLSVSGKWVDLSATQSTSVKTYTFDTSTYSQPKAIATNGNNWDNTPTKYSDDIEIASNTTYNGIYYIDLPGSDETNDKWSTFTHLGKPSVSAAAPQYDLGDTVVLTATAPSTGTLKSVSGMTYNYYYTTDGGTTYYKIAENAGTSVNFYPPAIGMYKFLVTATDGAGLETVQSDLSSDVQVGSVGYYVAGNTELTGTNWTQFSSKGAMTNDADTHWTKTFTAVPAGTHEFRITDITKAIGHDGTIYASDYTLTGNGVALTTNENKVQFTLNAKSKVTITFDATPVDGKYPVTVTVTDVVAVPVIVYAGKNGSVNVTYGSATTTIAAGKNETIQVAEGESIDLRAVPAEGYSFNRWAKNLALPYQIEGANAGASISGETITKRTTYVAYFSYGGGDLDFDDSAYSTVSNVSLKYSSGNGGSTYSGSSGTAISGTIKQNGNNYWIVLSSADLAAWKSGAASGTQLRWNMFNSGNSSMLTDKSGTTVDVSTNASGVTSKMENHDNNVFVEVSGLSDNITSLGILVNTTSKTVTYYTSASSGSGGDDYVPIVNFYAKDTIYYQRDGGSYEVNNMGDVDTTVTEVEDEVAVTEKDGKPWEAGTMLKGSPITVSTTIPHTGSFNGTNAAGEKVTGLKADEKYFVTGFSFNGYTPEILEEKAVVGTAGTTYTCTYVIPANMPEEMLEITPIFFIKKAYAYNTATFYLNGYEDIISEGWGNTLFIYPFYKYYVSGSDGTKTQYEGQAENFGGYPGQPVINYGGQLYTQIPLTNDGSPKGYNYGSENNTENPIKGVTINNGYFDTVHKTYCEFVRSHKQTYDYDDFAKIYNEKKDTLHSIYFSFKFKAQDTDKQHQPYSYTNNAGDRSRNNRFDSNTVTKTSDQLDTLANGDWEDLTDSLGNLVDLFGNKVKDKTATPLKVFSVGYMYNNSGSYATEWAVYYPDGDNYKLLYHDDSASGTNSSIVPSALIMNDSSSFSKYTAMDGDASIAGFEDIYEDLEAYSGVPVKICYEYDAPIKYNDPPAYRSDGRWTYTTDSDFVKSNIIIEYDDNSNNKHRYGGTGDTAPDTFVRTHEGTNTGCSAYFTNSDFYGEVTSATELISNTEKLTFTAEASDTYEFVGWYLYDVNGKSSTITTSSLSAETLRSGNFTIAARFKYIASGTLTISNKLAAGMAGRATTYLGVTLITGGQETVVKSVNSNTEPVKLEPSVIKKNSNYTIKIDIRTVPTGENKFASYACNTTNGSNEKDAASDSDIYSNDSDHGRTTGTASYLLHIANYTSGEDTVLGDIFNDDTQVVKAIEYVSTLTPVTYTYSVKFNYASRQYGDQAFTKSGTLTSGQINDVNVVTGTLNKTTDPDKKLTKAFLAKIAPHESNFNEKITWDFNDTVYNAQTCTYTDDGETLNTYAISLTIDKSNATIADDPNDVERHGYFTVPYEIESSDQEDTTNYAIPKTTGTKVYKAAADQTFTFDLNYDELFKVGDRYISAPALIYENVVDEGVTTVHERFFKYWEFSTVAGERGDSRVVGRCYFPEFNYRALDNYNIRAVYTKEDNEKFNPVDPTSEVIGLNAYGKYYNDAQMTTIDFIGNSRNQWNNGDNGTLSDGGNYVSGDLIYNDFILTFKPEGNTLFKDLSDTDKCGFVIQRLKQIELNSSGANAKTLQEYAKDYSDIVAARDAAEYMAGNTVKSAGDYNQIKVEINKADVNEKNRCHYAYSMFKSRNDVAKNNEKYLYRAFSYMIINGEYIISDQPTYFYMYDIAQM